MTTRIIRNDFERERLIELIRSRKLPMTVQVTKGGIRSAEQNRLQRLWHIEAAEQLGDQTPEEKRAFCKLHHGVPILRFESEDFRVRYDAVFRPLPYETKLALMAEPFDFPVTRLMSSEQKTRYLDQVWKHYSDLGVALTDPNALRFGGVVRAMGRGTPNAA